MDAQTRPPVLAKPRRRGFARAPTAIIFFLIRRPERNTPAREVQISTLLRGWRHEAEIQRLERLVWDAIYALQKAGLDREASRLRHAIARE
jgi:hypothetical protein